jgi:hypothetical protein
VAKNFHDGGIIGDGFDVVHDIRLLGLEDVARRRLADWRFAAALDIRRLLRFQNVQAHYLALSVVEQEVQEIETRDTVEASAEVMKELAEVAMMGDGFRDFEKGARARCHGVFGSDRKWSLAHSAG